MADRLAELSSRGVSVWLDDLSRERLATGSLDSLAEHDHVVGVTTNPTIFAKAIAPQRPLWASTSVKDPAYPDTRYVVDLVAPGVVNTMPESTLHAVADHGQVPPDSIRDHYDEAQEVLNQLAAVGVDYDDVTATLETNAIEIFDGSWQTAGEQVATALREQPRRGEDAV